MNDAAERLYERELEFIQEYARHFARHYPAEAGRLQPEPGRVTDPHAERFIEAFALLTGRVHHKIDNELPELTEAMLGLLYPHLLAPIPSMTIAQFETDPARPPPAAGVHVPRHTRLQTRPLGRPPQRCMWRTGYGVTLWPVRLSDARFLPVPLPPALREAPAPPPRTRAALVLRLECLGGRRFADLPLERLRLYLSGEVQMIASLYGALFTQVIEVAFRSPESGVKRPPLMLRPQQCLAQVGLGPDEGLLPFPRQSFVGHRLLMELLSFRDKFLFVELGGWDEVRRADFGGQAEVVLYMSQTQANLEQGVNARTFQLGCTPVVNAFEQSAEPAALTQTRTEYRVVPARTAPLGTEVYSVDAVACLDPERGGSLDFLPFYALAYDEDRASRQAFWYASRRASPVEDDPGTEVYLVLVDLQFDPRLPAEGVLHVRTTCTNRDLPYRLQRAGDELLPWAAGQAFAGPVRCLHAPTAPLRPGLRRAGQWRLLAQSVLNHVPLSDPDEGLAALQEVLRLCDFADPDAGQHLLAAINRQVIEGITALRGRHVIGRARGRSAIGACRGVEFTVEFDEQKYVGTGVFLVACVLERFLGLYAAVNSFSQLVARIKQAEGILKKWPPRAAEIQLL